MFFRLFFFWPIQFPLFSVSHLFFCASLFFFYGFHPLSHICYSSSFSSSLFLSAIPFFNFLSFFALSFFHIRQSYSSLTYPIVILFSSSPSLPLALFSLTCLSSLSIMSHLGTSAHHFLGTLLFSSTSFRLFLSLFLYPYPAFLFLPFLLTTYPSVHPFSSPTLLYACLYLYLFILI